ncbi:MAG TPA: ATP-dependent 6-phosphofructokinase [Pirellulaceae bacterium]|nr:ATP-dependent 6-phosphofructokinase [Pirellulaceae bacterium]HMO93335.1 ATP-dependent 6-phosphofructokinase [Pirellulaceae bacterium]HMP70106.1 ATP-dependent 6-phosphofructokinase [Pirellulaceae bacterium]
MRIGVFCSGGDSPGMNACVRAVVRSAIHRGHQVVGIKRGYHGLLTEQFFTSNCGSEEMTIQSVAGWAQFGGAFLHSSRSEEFRTEAGRMQAAEILRARKIDALIPIGGDGTFRGAVELAKVWDGQIVGCPGTIDNDLNGTDYTIGFSTAVRTAVDAVDKLIDTASSHDRLFLVEVMGRHSGYIGMYAALAGAAEVAAIPETETNISEIVAHLHQIKAQGKNSAIMIVSEGDEMGGANQIQKLLDENGCPFKSRVVVLGHLQRGGAPTPEDRRRATQMGDGAVAAILRGETGVMVGTKLEEVHTVPFEQTFASHRAIRPALIELLNRMVSC